MPFELPKIRREEMLEYASVALSPPEALTMDRVSEKSDVIVAQSTSQFFRCLCFQPSINWIVSEEDNFVPGMNPFDLRKTSGWIHEESPFWQRSCSHFLPGCRETVYRQHAGVPPDALVRSERSGYADGCCRVQAGDLPEGLSDDDRVRDLVAVHRKHRTCGTNLHLGSLICPLCFDLPYLETRDAADENTLGVTRYVCDAYPCVPKYDVHDARGQHRYRIRPDTCFCGCCVRPRCGGKRGRCLRVPFVVRDPATHEALSVRPPSKLEMDRSTAIPLRVDSKARVDVLWSGWANELCAKRNAYHLAFPHDATVEDKLTLIGSSILLDVTMYEQQGDD